MRLTLIVVILGVLSTFALCACATDKTNSTNAQQATLKVFFIPHSHQDAGWLKTVDEYYEQEVKYVYNTVIEQLNLRADRKFIIVEMVFFSRWYNEATDSQRELVHQFVQNKKIEFVLGGWVMNDDADPTYSASINQMTEGHQWIYETFGVIPRYGWHIDPFGLSSYYPVLFAKMGFNGHVINRIHYQQKDQWKAEQHMEFIWRGTDSLGNRADVLTHVLDSHYSFPSGFNFEVDAPITDSNIDARSQSLVNELLKRATWYRTINLLVPGGDDFRWQNAEVQYTNWDKLIDYINARTSTFNVEIHYSTLSEYFEALHSTNTNWPVYSGDFFPYADGSDAYWTGYFTSYANLKANIRSRATLLRTTELFSQAAALSPSTPFSKDPHLVVPLRQATGIAQHHDGVTGTSKYKVVEMYEGYLADGTADAEELVIAAVASLVNETAPLSMAATNINRLSSGQVVPIIVTNGLGWKRSQVPIDIVLDRSDIEIIDEEGNVVLYQIQPSHRSSQYNLTFFADVPEAGFSTYFARQTNNPVVVNPVQIALGSAISLNNKALQVNVTVEPSGELSLLITNFLDGSTFTFTEQILEYTSYTGSGQKSGAYIFRPVGAANSLSSAGSVFFVDGPVVQEIRHQYDESHVQIFRLFKSSNPEISQYLDLNLAIGPLELDRECIVRLTSNLNDGSLFTDNNGLLMHKRPSRGGSIASNYYPLVSQSYLSNGNNEVIIFSDRTVGIGTLTPGQFELMAHRRCSQDDGRGVGEALNDQTATFPRFRLFFGKSSNLESLRPRLSIVSQHPTIEFYGALATMSSWTSTHILSYSILRRPLPNNVHLLAFKTDVENNWKSALVRLQHIYEVHSDPSYGIPVEVDIPSLFTGNYFISDELELSGRLEEANLPRLNWPSAGTTPVWEIPYFKKGTRSSATLFSPMEIHVYRLFYTDA